MRSMVHLDYAPCSPLVGSLLMVDWVSILCPARNRCAKVPNNREGAHCGRTMANPEVVPHTAFRDTISASRNLGGVNSVGTDYWQPP
jgi:hypothetical protein